MGVTNIGQQAISLDFKAPGQARLINQLMHGIVPTGIMHGFTLLPNSGANTVTIQSSEANPSLMLIADANNDMSIRCECTANITIPCEVTKRTVIARFSWIEVEDNFVDFYAINDLDVEPTDIVIGTVVYNGTTLTTNIDYSTRTNSPLNVIAELDTFFTVLPDLIPSQKIRVFPGKAVINGVLVETDTTIEYTMPDATGLTASQIRYDIVYINPLTKSVAAITGTAGTVINATVPPFPTEGLAIAIVKRVKDGGGVLQGIVGQDITSTKSIFNSYSGKVGNFYCGNYPTTSSALFKVGGGTNISPKDLVNVTNTAFTIDCTNGIESKTKITTNGANPGSIVTGGISLNCANSTAFPTFKITQGSNDFRIQNGDVLIANYKQDSTSLILSSHSDSGSQIILNNDEEADTLTIRNYGGYGDIISPQIRLQGTKTTIESTNGLEITSTVDSTSTTTGALTVAGGVGIKKSLSVGGKLTFYNTGGFLHDVPVWGGNFSNRIKTYSYSFTPVPKTNQMITISNLGLTSATLVKSVEITYSNIVVGADSDYGRRILSGEALGWYLLSGELRIVAYWTLLTSQPRTDSAQVLITYTPSTTWNNT